MVKTNTGAVANTIPLKKSLHCMHKLRITSEYPSV